MLLFQMEGDGRETQIKIKIKELATMRAPVRFLPLQHQHHPAAYAMSQYAKPPLSFGLLVEHVICHSHTHTRICSHGSCSLGPFS